MVLSKKIHIPQRLIQKRAIQSIEYSFQRHALNISSHRHGFIFYAFLLKIVMSLFSSETFGTFAIHMSTATSYPQAETCSRMWALRLVRFVEAQRWLCVCVPKFQPLSSNNWAKIKRIRLAIGTLLEINVKTYFTCMVDESGSISTHRCIDHMVFVNLEHVTSNTTSIVIPFPFVGQCGTY